MFYRKSRGSRRRLQQHRRQLLLKVMAQICCCWLRSLSENVEIVSGPLSFATDHSNAQWDLVSQTERLPQIFVEVLPFPLKLNGQCGFLPAECCFGNSTYLRKHSKRISSSRVSKFVTENLSQQRPIIFNKIINKISDNI